MPHLTADALVDDPDGLGFLRAVLDQPSPLAPPREFVPTIGAQLTPQGVPALRDAQPDNVAGLPPMQAGAMCEASTLFAYTI
jgi:hypothetical protein